MTSLGKAVQTNREAIKAALYEAIDIAAAQMGGRQQLAIAICEAPYSQDDQLQKAA